MNDTLRCQLLLLIKHIRSELREQAGDNYSLRRLPDYLSPEYNHLLFDIFYVLNHPETRKIKSWDGLTTRFNSHYKTSLLEGLGWKEAVNKDITIEDKYLDVFIGSIVVLKMLGVFGSSSYETIADSLSCIFILSLSSSSLCTSLKEAVTDANMIEQLKRSFLQSGTKIGQPIDNQK